MEPIDFFYSDGTISVTNGSDIATGQFTSWDPGVLPYDIVFVNDGLSGANVVAEVVSATEMRLAKPWAGATLASVPYFILRWIKHTDPKIYGVRVSDYLTRVKSISNDIIAERDAAIAKVQEAATGAGVLLSGSNLADVPNKPAAAINLGLRERLTANRTYYVRTNGSDSNNGLSDTAGGAFATVQKAYDTITKGLDLNGYNVTVRIADGTYTSGIEAMALPTGARVAQDIAFIGNIAAPQNVVFSITNGHVFNVGEDNGGGGWLYLNGMTIQTAGTFGSALRACNGTAQIIYENIRFGSCVDWHIESHHAAFVKAVGDYQVVGGAKGHIYAASGSVVVPYSRTITFSNSPHFSSATFISAGAELYASNMTFINGSTVTGQRFAAADRGYISTGGAGLTYFPGNSAGTESNGGNIDGGTAWQAYTPLVSSVTGTLGSYAVEGFYKQIGKTVYVRLKISITNNGTGDTLIRVTLPAKAKADTIGYGREDASLGHMLQGRIYADASIMDISNFTGAYPGGTGRLIIMSATYETA